MKKIIFIAIAFTIFSSVTYAQFGITGGLNISKYKYDNADRKEILSWNAGITYRVSGRKSVLVVQPQLLYTGKGAVKYADIDPNSDVLKYTNNIKYVEFSMPFLLSIPMDNDDDFRVELGVGPYAGYIASAKYTMETYEGDKTTASYKIGSSNTDDFKPTDMGLSLVAAIKWGPIGLNTQYDLGLSNVNPRSGTPLKMRAVMFNMYIYFGK